jgi:hypothetical protein
VQICTIINGNLKQMKKLKNMVQITAVIVTLPLLIFLSFNRHRSNWNLPEHIEVKRKTCFTNENITVSRGDTSVPVILNSKFIVINYEH